MTLPVMQRTRRAATEEEHQRLKDYRSKAEQDLANLRRQGIEAQRRLREAAMREPTVTGQQRRAIAESGMGYLYAATRVNG